MEETLPDEGEGATEPAASPRRKKSTGFPVVSLAEAAPILKQAGRYGFTHSMSAFASYMGHSTTNSGAFRQRLAAFRDWKLVSGRGDSLEMTETARAIAHPESDHAEIRALQSAFMNCLVFYRLYDESAKGIALNPDGLGSRGVLEAGVSPASKHRFVESFLASAVIAGLAEMLDDGHVLLLPFASEDEQDEQDEQSSPSEVTVVAPPATARAEAPSPLVVTPVVHQVWEIDGGSILFEIRTLKPFPASAFAIVGDVFQNLEHLAKTLGPIETSTSDTSSQ
jgi:hypothetical protein